MQLHGYVKSGMKTVSPNPELIALDTNIFIYWLENNPEYYKSSTAIIGNVLSGKFIGCCSTLVLAELYYGNSKTIDAITHMPNLSVIPVTNEVATLAGKLRFERGLKLVDSTHLASALLSGAKNLYTNDAELLRLKSVDSLKIIRL